MEPERIILFIGVTPRGVTNSTGSDCFSDLCCLDISALRVASQLVLKGVVNIYPLFIHPVRDG